MFELFTKKMMKYPYVYMIKNRRPKSRAHSILKSGSQPADPYSQSESSRSNRSSSDAENSTERAETRGGRSCRTGFGRVWYSILLPRPLAHRHRVCVAIAGDAARCFVAPKVRALDLGSRGNAGIPCNRARVRGTHGVCDLGGTAFWFMLVWNAAAAAATLWFSATAGWLLAPVPGKVLAEFSHHAVRPHGVGRAELLRTCHFTRIPWCSDSADPTASTRRGPAATAAAAAATAAATAADSAAAAAFPRGDRAFDAAPTRARPPVLAAEAANKRVGGRVASFGLARADTGDEGRCDVSPIGHEINLAYAIGGAFSGFWPAATAAGWACRTDADSAAGFGGVWVDRERGLLADCGPGGQRARRRLGGFTVTPGNEREIGRRVVVVRHACVTSSYRNRARQHAAGGLWLAAPGLEKGGRVTLMGRRRR